MKKVYKAISYIGLILTPKGQTTETTTDVNTTIDGVSVNELTNEEQQQLIESQEAAITESVDENSIDSITTTLEEGSIIIKSIVKFIQSEATRLGNALTEAVANNDSETSFITKLTAQINNRMTSIDTTILDKLTDTTNITGVTETKTTVTGCA